MNSSRKYYLLIAALILASLNLHTGWSQNYLYDSLKSSIDTLSGQVKADRLKNAAIIFESTSLVKGLYFADQREALIKQMSNDTLLADNYNLIGNLYLESGLLSKAEENYKVSLALFDKLHDFEGRSIEKHNLGLVYLLRNDTIKSVDYFKQSLDDRYRTNNNRRIGDGLTTLGEVYLDYGDHEKSITCLFEAIDYFIEEASYRRKFECYAYLADNFLVINPEKALRWINEMKNIYQLDTTISGIEKFRIDFRLGQYYLAVGDYLNSIRYLEQIDIENDNLSDEYRPIQTFRNLSARLYEAGEIEKSLHFSTIARQIHKSNYDIETADIINTYKTRLDFRSTEEEISRTEELNSLVLKRIKTERLLKFALYLILVILITIVIILLINFIIIRKSQSDLEVRRVELDEAYNRNIAYKKSILNIRENKNIFFNILTDKLLHPFTELTDKLNQLSINAQESFNKNNFLSELDQIFILSKSIEKSLKRILIWSKLQRKQYYVSLELINVNDFLHELLPEIIKMGIRKQIKIRFDSDPSLNIRFDKKALRSILKILVENSVDHSKNDSEIIIRGQKASKGCIISVTDFGDGIPPIIQDTIFEVVKGETADRVINHEKLGLGLLMAKHLAELNSSHLSFESRRNRGTTFHLHVKN